MPSSFPFYPHMQLSFHNRCPLHAERRKETEINASGSFRTQQKGGWRSAEKTGKSENKPENKAGDEGLIWLEKRIKGRVKHHGTQMRMNPCCRLRLLLRSVWGWRSLGSSSRLTSPERRLIHRKKRKQNVFQVIGNENSNLKYKSTKK